MPPKGKKGLGTGLDALFRDTYTEKELPTEISIEKIEPRKDQPRIFFEQESLEALSESIQQYGIIQPITVREIDSGYYQIIAGERRWRAAKLAGLKEVPVKIIEADDKKASEIALVENLQRENLNPIEEAKGYRSLIDVYQLTQDEVSRSVGKSRPAVANSLRLLYLCDDVIKLVEDSKLSAGHARTLVTIDDPEKQLAAAMEIIEKGLSVRKAEQLAASIIKKKPEKKEIDPLYVDYSKEVSEDLTKRLGRKVQLSEGRKTGKITLEYYGAEDRELLIALLSRLNEQ